MPLTVKKTSGNRPWKLINKDTGEVEGSSKTKREAMISKWIREHPDKRRGKK